MRKRPTAHDHFSAPPLRRGFTLVEILIVVVILGILSAIVVPKLSNASQLSREAVLKEDCRFLRTQIITYALQHRDVYPGYPNNDTTATATATDFLDQLVRHSSEFGQTAATNAPPFIYGPYLTRMPDNPLNSLSTIKLDTGRGTLVPDGTTGWVYQPLTGNIIPNLTGSDSGGRPFASY